MTLYRVRHLTRYRYEAPVVHAHHVAHMRLSSSAFQRVLSSDVTTTPAVSWDSSVLDYHGNQQDLFEILGDHDLLEVIATSEVEPLPRRTPEQLLACHMTWEETRVGSGARFSSPDDYSYDSPLVRTHADLLNYATSSFTHQRPIVEAIGELNQRIFSEFTYDPLATDVSTPLAEVLREKRGVCQDFAHLAIGCLRSLGLAARYVSGYVETAPPPGRPRLVGADASHAWAEVYVPELGWLEFDPTNAVFPGTTYVRVAQGRDFGDVSPLKGVVLGGGHHTLTVEVDMIPVPDSSADLL